MSATTTHQNVPPELWSRIFYWATYTPMRHHDLDPLPFDHPHTLQATLKAHKSSSMFTKKTLVLVCWPWHALAMEYLYEEIVVGHHTAALAALLEDSAGSSCLGVSKFVRWIVIPTVQPDWIRRGALREGDTFQEDTIRIIRACSNALRLTNGNLYGSWHRKINTPDPSMADAIFSLPRLRRFDWENPAGDYIKICLPSVLWMRQDIEVLSLIGDIPFPQQTILSFPHLHTLLLKVELPDSTYPIKMISQSSFPNLRRVILKAPFPADPWANLGESFLRSLEFWTHFGQTLRMVEFGFHTGFIERDEATMMLQNCPLLEVFNYPIFFNKPFAAPHAALREIGLHLQPMGRKASHNKLDHQLQHFKMMAGDSYPSLERLVLYGGWRGIATDVRCDAVLREIQARGVQVVCQDS